MLIQMQQRPLDIGGRKDTFICETFYWNLQTFLGNIVLDLNVLAKYSRAIALLQIKSELHHKELLNYKNGDVSQYKNKKK